MGNLVGEIDIAYLEQKRKELQEMAQEVLKEGLDDKQRKME